MLYQSCLHWQVSLRFPKRLIINQSLLHSLTGFTFSIYFIESLHHTLIEDDRLFPCLSIILVNLLFWERLHNLLRSRQQSLIVCVPKNELFLAWLEVLLKDEDYFQILWFRMFVLRCSWSWFDTRVVQALRTRLRLRTFRSKIERFEFIYLWHVFWSIRWIGTYLKNKKNIYLIIRWN